MTARPDPRRNDWLLIPNLLTLTRFVAAALVPAAFIGFEPARAAELALALFVYASITDFVDGQLARRLNQTSRLGATLDTLADKALMLTTLTALCATSFADAPWFWAGTALIAIREIGVTVLRRLRPDAPGLTVTLAAKLKTTAQMTAAACLIAVPVVDAALRPGWGAAPGQALWALGVGLFALAVWLTVSTGLAYFRAS